ncbi:hypothetical protein IEO_03076 [Bacillus wiedmannii]|uniref:hypothetical protein n=1 Tax=Bacillus wiedmannii TaxID=1890302 RepID=UPI00027C016C|nr:hypothetical protein [Bacillus wiedmannii]EJV61781.1 hypothetical protein IEO_03076 [Bacillus wiedmannii]
MAEVTKIECKDGNIYEVDGKRYRELSKEPAVGDTILVVDMDESSWGYSEGSSYEVLNVYSGDGCDVLDDDGDENYISKGEFVIVEPIEKSIVQETDQLTRKLTRLEERTEENHRNILTFSQMAESARSDGSKAIGGVNALDEQLDLVREDIVFLDEKIDELEESMKERSNTPSITINIENFNVSGTESLKEFIERIAKGCGKGVM